MRLPFAKFNEAVCSRPDQQNAAAGSEEATYSKGNLEIRIFQRLVIRINFIFVAGGLVLSLEVRDGTHPSFYFDFQVTYRPLYRSPV